MGITRVRRNLAVAATAVILGLVAVVGVGTAGTADQPSGSLQPKSETPATGGSLSGAPNPTTAPATPAQTSSDPGTLSTGDPVPTTDPGAVATDPSADPTTAAATTLPKPVPFADPPPTPTDDSFTAIGAGVVDVIANDSDPSNKPLSIASTTQPSHGTATCGALGGCLYQANAGYTGADAFTYTVTNGSTTATANVTVNVTTGGGGGGTLPPVANDDILATAKDTPATINVLANDTDPGGLPLTVDTTLTKDPAHGTVACVASGDCTYTPTAGFTGFDFFQYTATNGAATDGAFVQVRVGSGTIYLANAGGTPASVEEGASVDWFGGAKGIDGLPDEYADLATPPAATVKLTGAHNYVPGSAHVPVGWSIAYSTDGTTFGPDEPANPVAIRFTASPDALLGDQVTQTFPAPLPPIAQGTGGDGHVPIPVGSKVFAIFHHQQPTQVSCVDRATGQLCPGYPIALNVGASNNIGPAVVIGSRFYVHARIAYSYAQSAPIALFCWDASTNQTCGLNIIARIPSTSDRYATFPVEVGSQMWLAADNGNAYCVDEGTGALCGTFPTGITESPGSDMDIKTHNGKVFVSEQSGSLVGCVEASTGAKCAGFAAPVAFPGYDLINRHDASGNINGICASSGTSLGCSDDTTPSNQTQFTDFPLGSDTYTFTQESETGTRTFGCRGPGNHTIGCWDWTTSAPCTGANFTNGIVSQAQGGGSLPDAYGATWDGSCTVALGDSGQVYTIDPNGVSPCTSLGSGAAPRVVDLRTQRCDGTVGAATWNEARLDDVDLTVGAQFQSLVVTVKDAETQEVVLTKDMVGTNGHLDLSGIDAKTHPSLQLDASAVTLQNNTSWNGGHQPKLVFLWNADPESGCFQTTPPVNCPVASPSPIGISVTVPDTADAAASAAVTLPSSCQSTTTTGGTTTGTTGGTTTGTGTTGTGTTGSTTGAGVSNNNVGNTPVADNSTGSTGSSTGSTGVDNSTGSTTDSGVLATTGARIGSIVLVGLVLLGAGLVLTRRGKGAHAEK